MILALAIIGFVISFYAVIEVVKINKNRNYKPLCDFSELVSCSRAFQSRFGRGFGIPNPIVGLIYYLVVALFYYVGLFDALIYVTGIGLIFSLLYSYLLYFKVKSICVVCTAIYVVNILLFIFSF